MVMVLVPAPSNFCPHGPTEVGQVNHFRLLGRIFNDGFAIGQGSGHHQGFSGPHTGIVQINFGPLQSPSRTRYMGMNGAMLDVNIGPHGLQPAHMQFHGTGSNGTAAGERNAGYSHAGQQGPNHEKAGPQRLTTS
jgi:hypothetical protein